MKNLFFLKLSTLFFITSGQFMSTALHAQEHEPSLTVKTVVKNKSHADRTVDPTLSNAENDAENLSDIESNAENMSFAENTWYAIASILCFPLWGPIELDRKEGPFYNAPNWIRWLIFYGSFWGGLSLPGVLPYLGASSRAATLAMPLWSQALGVAQRTSLYLGLVVAWIVIEKTRHGV